MKNVINRAFAAEKKIFLTLILAVAGCVWMTAKAYCLADYEASDSVYISVRGVLQAMAFPCEEGEDCPNCLTLAVNTGTNTYYLIAYTPEVEELLNKQKTPLDVTVSGMAYSRGSYDFIITQHLWVNYVRPEALCDTWRVLNEPPSIYDRKTTTSFRLATDTIINDRRYARLESSFEPFNSVYEGAIREGDNADIYFIPDGSTHEYLLYAFNAKVGDRLENVWAGGRYMQEECPNGYNAFVTEIDANSAPKQITIAVQTAEEQSVPLVWIDGIGLEDGPIGSESNGICPGHEDLGVYSLLCAEKEGELIYKSPKSKDYGCAFEGYGMPDLPPTDTIPLTAYIGDDPGSSTVDPVDPNQVVATLQGNELGIKETSGDMVTLTLAYQNGYPASRRLPADQQEQTFRNRIYIQLMEEGVYTIQLSNPDWKYIIYGTFRYPMINQAVDEVHAHNPSVEKILRDGQLFIEREGKIFTLTGIQVK